MNVYNCFFCFCLDYTKALDIKLCHCKYNCSPGSRHYWSYSEHKAMSDFGFPFDSYDLDMFTDKNPFRKTVANGIMQILYHIT